MITATAKLTKHEQGLIKKALEYQDSLSIDDVIKKISTGEYAAIRGDRTIATIEVMGDTLHIAQYAGTLADLPDLAAAFIRISRELGKRYITMNGRKGWTKVLKQYGMIPIKQNKYTHYRRDNYGWR